MKLNSIKFKVVAFTIFCLMAGGLAIIYLINDSYKTNINVVSEQSIKTSVATFENLQNNTYDMLSSTLEVGLGNKEISAAYAGRDRDKVLEIVTPIYKDLKKRYGLTHWNYFDMEKNNNDNGLVNFLRLSDTKLYGDFVKRITLENAFKTKTFTRGLELGKTGFVLRVLHPISYDGKQIGYFELGKGIETFFDSMKSQTGNEYGVLIRKDKFDPKYWELTRKAQQLRNNWDDQKDLLLVKNTTDNDSIFSFQGSLANLPDSGQVLGLVHKNNIVYTRGIHPIKDVSGSIVGAVFVLRDITSMYNDMKAMQTKAIVFIALLMVIISIMMIFMISKLIFARLKKITKIATRVVGGDFETKIVASANDEIGEFESLFEQFRTVFVDTLSELEQKNKEQVK